MIRTPFRGRARALAVSATLTGLAASSLAAAQELYFEDVPTAFDGQGCGGEGCWTNYMRLTDLDGDGALDAIFPNTSGWFSSPGAQPLEVWLGDGAGGFRLATDVLFGGPVVATIRVIAVGDVDGDGDRDLVAPSASGQRDRLYIQQANGTFLDEGATRLGTSSRSAAARLADVDADGDLDLFLGQGYVSSDAPPARLYLNDGQGDFEESAGALPASAEGNDPDDVDFFDVDGDFDVDILLNTHTGPNSLWINDGAGLFLDGSAALPAPEGDGYHYGPTACDIDGDGDRDLLIDNIGPSYREQVLVNDGSGSFSSESARLAGNTGADDNGLVCLDFDEDGDQDVIVVSLGSPGERLFENLGDGQFQVAGDAFTATFDPSLWMEVGDVDGDGRLDVVTAQGEGSPEAERLYLGTDAVAIDTSAPVIFAWDVETFWPEVRFAVRDGSTSDEGPRLRDASAEFPNAEAPVPATFMGGDLYRFRAPDEATTFALCATDWAGNRGCVDVEHVGGGGGGGSGAGGGATTATSSATSTVSGPGATASASGTTTAAGTGGGDGAGGGEPETAILDRGCGCTVVGGGTDRSTTGATLALLALAGTAWASRRRARGAR